MKHIGGRDVVETPRLTFRCQCVSSCSETIGEYNQSASPPPFEILTGDFQQSAALVKQRNPISGLALSHVTRSLSRS